MDIYYAFSNFLHNFFEEVHEALTEYIIATHPILDMTIQLLKFMSAIKHTGADIMVAHRLNKKTTTSSAGYSFIILACKITLIYMYFLKK